MGTIVVGYTNRPEGRAALKRAFDEASLRRLNLVIVTSQPLPRTRGHDPGSPDRQALTDIIREHEVTGVACHFRDTTPSIDPAEDLLEAISETDAELVVIGLRRRTAVGKFLMGSTAQRVLLEAPCPVLGVKATDEES